jgi:hypothetical protein
LHIERIAGVIGVLKFPFQARRKEGASAIQRLRRCPDGSTQRQGNEERREQTLHDTGNLAARKAHTKFFFQSNHV